MYSTLVCRPPLHLCYMYACEESLAKVMFGYAIILLNMSIQEAIDYAV